MFNSLWSARKHCPHKNRVNCPLYRAAHFGEGYGCDDGHLETMECAVDRGAMDYEEAVALGRENHWTRQPTPPEYRTNTRR